mmetsp:Transcript_109875/g.154036  ORF Transcript_109875/g.154036 Transcript_109875/m.154036 type:complete len:149 (-) Transcript_109875:494-940(-)
MARAAWFRLDAPVPNSRFLAVVWPLDSGVGGGRGSQEEDRTSKWPVCNNSADQRALGGAKKFVSERSALGWADAARLSEDRKPRLLSGSAGSSESEWRLRSSGRGGRQELCDAPDTAGAEGPKTSAISRCSFRSRFLGESMLAADCSS